MQSLVWLVFGVILGLLMEPTEAFRGFPVVSVGRSAALHLDAGAPAGLFCRVKTRISAAFARHCGFYSSDLVCGDYFVCFQAWLTEFADLLFISLMRCVFVIVIRRKKIDELLNQRDLFCTFLDKFAQFVEF